MTAIIKRELYAYFCSPLAYVVLAIFTGFSGFFFYAICLSGDTASLTYVFTNMFLVTILVNPIMCMRLFSDEKKEKTDQALLTAPVNVFSIVMGKFCAAGILYFVCMLIYIIFGFVLSFFVSPSWPVIICNFLGLLLLGLAMTAINVFLSSLTESQMIAAIMGFAVGLFVYLYDSIVSVASSAETLYNILLELSFLEHYENFTVGILNISDVVFFLSVIALFVFLTVRVVEKRRWS